MAEKDQHLRETTGWGLKGGRPNGAAARMMGKSFCKDWLRRVLERREITESRSCSMGRPKIVFTVTSGPRAIERIMGEPEVSVYGVR
jgi:hypothetical protein